MLDGGYAADFRECLTHQLRRTPLRRSSEKPDKAQFAFLGFCGLHLLQTSGYLRKNRVNLRN